MKTELLKVGLGLVVTAQAIALLAMLAALTAHHNPYDAMPIKCGQRLRDVCPTTGINWSKP